MLFFIHIYTAILLSYENFVFQSSRNDGLPEFLCFECYGHVKRFVKFRDKCQRANFALKELLHQNKEVNIQPKNYLK